MAKDCRMSLKLWWHKPIVGRPDQNIRLCDHTFSLAAPRPIVVVRRNVYVHASVRIPSRVFFIEDIGLLVPKQSQKTRKVNPQRAEIRVWLISSGHSA